MSMVLAISIHRTWKASQFWKQVSIELIKEVRREEILQFPRSFISLVSYCVIANHYYDSLINIALQRETIDLALRKAKKNMQKLYLFNARFYLDNSFYRRARLY